MQAEWRVHVFGPPLGQTDPSTPGPTGLAGEEGTPGHDWFRIAAMDTEAVPIPPTPGYGDCVHLGDSLNITWQTVPQASLYRLEMTKFRCSLGPGCQGADPKPIMGEEVPSAPASTQNWLL